MRQPVSVPYNCCAGFSENLRGPEISTKVLGQKSVQVCRARKLRCRTHRLVQHTPRRQQPLRRREVLNSGNSSCSTTMLSIFLEIVAPRGNWMNLNYPLAVPAPHLSILRVLSTIRAVASELTWLIRRALRCVLCTQIRSQLRQAVGRPHIGYSVVTIQF